MSPQAVTVGWGDPDTEQTYSVQLYDTRLRKDGALVWRFVEHLSPEYSDFTLVMHKALTQAGDWGIPYLSDLKHGDRVSPYLLREKILITPSIEPDSEPVSIFD